MTVEIRRYAHKGFSYRLLKKEASALLIQVCRLISPTFLVGYKLILKQEILPKFIINQQTKACLHTTILSNKCMYVSGMDGYEYMKGM